MQFNPQVTKLLGMMMSSYLSQEYFCTNINRRPLTYWMLVCMSVLHVHNSTIYHLIVFGGDELLHPVTVLAGQCLDQRQLQSVMLHNCRALIQERRANPQQRIWTLVLLMQRRVAACVTPRGGPTSYLTCCMHIYYSTGSIK